MRVETLSPQQERMNPAIAGRISYVSVYLYNTTSIWCLQYRRRRPKSCTMMQCKHTEPPGVWLGEKHDQTPSIVNSVTNDEDDVDIWNSDTTRFPRSLPPLRTSETRSTYETANFDLPGKCFVVVVPTAHVSINFDFEWQHCKSLNHPS